MNKIFTIAFLVSIHVAFGQLSNIKLNLPSVPGGEVSIRLNYGYIIKSNGDSIFGRVTFSLSEGKRIYYFKDEHTHRADKLKAEEVNYIKLQDGRKFSVQRMKNKKGKVLVKLYEVITLRSKKMILYRRFKSMALVGTNFNNGGAVGAFVYYVSIEGKLNFTFVSNTSKELFPFNEKLAELLVDCPALSNKIKEKQGGYEMTGLKPEIVIWKRISEEYENCK